MAAEAGPAEPAARRRPAGPTPAGQTLIPARPPFFARLSSLALRLALTCTARVRVEGLDRIPSDRALILASNHASNADGLLLMAYVRPAMNRMIGWLGKEEALRWPVMGWAIAHNGVFGIRRGAGDLEAFRTARRVLDEGGVLGVFPEGTRSPTGELQQGKQGAATLALRTGTTIVPVGIAGSQRYWGKGRPIPRPGARITVRIGEPFSLSAAAATGSRHRALEDATTELMRHIAALLPPDQRGAYGGGAASERIGEL